jgi:hypothetical protein
MRTSLALALLAAGGILTFAVKGHPGFLDVQLAGLILIATALAALWLRIGSARLARAGSQLVAAGTRIARSGAQAIEGLSLPGQETRQRVPLSELLGYETDAAAPADPADLAAADQSEHEGIRS